MSFNIKNLSYESNEPTFIRRLRAESAVGVSTNPRRPNAGPRKQTKVEEDDDDEEPTYVVEESQHTLSRVEYNALVKAENSQKHCDKGTALSSDSYSLATATSSPKLSPESALQTGKEIIGIGISTKKRKTGKTICHDHEEGFSEKEDSTLHVKKATKKMKKKKVKLSFDEIP